MAFPDDLLGQARHLARLDRRRPKQANLRRAVSTAYYALFHLLVTEAASYWRLEHQRTTLARVFEHGKMRSAASRCSSSSMNADLKAVAAAFVELQQSRHLADYDNAQSWTRVDAISLIDTAGNAFQRWASIRGQRMAQDFLLSLLVDRK